MLFITILYHKITIGNGIPIIEIMDASPITPNRGKPSNMKKTNDKTSSMA